MVSEMFCLTLGITSEQFWVYGWWNRHGDFTTFWVAIVSYCMLNTLRGFTKKIKKEHYFT